MFTLERFTDDCREAHEADQPIEAIWAVVGQYVGQEDTTFYEERGGDLVQVGAQSIRAGEVVPLNNQTIHAIWNASTNDPCRALHVYGGDLTGANCRFWEPESGEKNSAKTGDLGV